MLKSFKTEITPTEEQKTKIRKTIGTCRYVYNFYLSHNKTLHDNGEKFMTGKDFSLWLNNEYIPNNSDKAWIKEVYSKAVKQSIEDGYTAFTRFFKHQSAFPKFKKKEYIPNNSDKAWIKEVYSKAVKQSIEDGYTAFTRFFKHQSAFPKFKKKGKSDVKMYFVRNNQKDCQCERHRLKIPTLGWVRIKEKGYIPTTKDGYVIKSGTVSMKADRFYVSQCERHRLKIPTLGWVRIKEKGYIPTTKDGYVIKSGTVSMKADRFYVSVLIEISDNRITGNYSEGIGIDLGLKDFAIVSNGKTYKNINKSVRLRKLEKQLIREQRCLSRKYENLKKGESTQRANIQKQKLKVQKLHHKMDSIRTDYINKTIAEIVKTKPSYITIEDLNVKGMMKNRHLSKAVAFQKFYEFRSKLKAKCDENNIELRVVDRFYPSSKTCHHCGSIKKDLKLSDRIYRCECGYVADRDFNGALNLKDAKTYKIA